MRFIMKRYVAFVITSLLLLYVTVEKVNAAAVSKETKCSMTTPCVDQFGEGANIQFPPQIKSKSSDWSTTLTVDIGKIQFGWLHLWRRLYNEVPTGPTITVKRGDKLHLQLVNKLSPAGNDNGNGLNKQRFPNTTNLHTHGFHISSAYGQDNVLVHIQPDTTFDFHYEIIKNNTPGTYWYHAHVHGSTGFQVNGGLAGMLIIQDEPGPDMDPALDAVSCPNHCHRDIQLVFQPLLVFDDFTGYQDYQEEIGDYYGFTNDQYIVEGTDKTLTYWLQHVGNISHVTTNGQYLPTLKLTTFTMYRFRMANAAGRPHLELYIAKKMPNGSYVPADSCVIREIALDGLYLPKPRKMLAGQSLIVPGGRVDWMLYCKEEGTYTLRGERRKWNNPSMGIGLTFTGDLVTIVATQGTAKTDPAFPQTLPKLFHRDLQNVAEEDIQGRFVVEFGPQIILNREPFCSGEKFRYKMVLGQTQEWHLVNSNTFLAHPIHIHVNAFQVISYNNYTGGYGVAANKNHPWFLNDIMDESRNCFYQHLEYFSDDVPHGLTKEEREKAFKYLGHDKRWKSGEGYTGYAQKGDWHDTLLLPPLVNITIRFVPVDFTGTVVIHCHILEHEDAGMFMVVEIVNEGESTEAEIKSCNAYPGTCRKCDRWPPNNATDLCGVTDGAEKLPEEPKEN